MKIAQLTHLFSPDELAGASLYTDLARYLRDRGHDIRVTTTFSYYPALRYRTEDQGIATRDEVWEGIPVRRIGMFLPEKHKGWRRLLPEMSYLYGLVRYGAWKDWTPDVIVTACPMLAQSAALPFLNRMYGGRRIPCLVVVQDLMVDAALELGILKSRAIVNVLRRFERWALRKASLISTISEQMKHKVEHVGPPTCILPNWIHESLAREAGAIRSRTPARDRRRLFYSGNLGVKQGLPEFVGNFVQCRDSWTLELHGGGAVAQAVRSAVAGHRNISLEGLLEERDYLKRLARSSACLITQRAGVGANFLPSKVLPALATGTPILAVCDEHTPLGREVISAGLGAVVPPGDVQALRSVLERWGNAPSLLVAHSAAARKRAAQYSRQRILSMYERRLLGISESVDEDQAGVSASELSRSKDEPVQV